LMVRCESERSQAQNKITALGLLRARLWETQQRDATSKHAQHRKDQVGCGMRADKRRTVRCQDGQVNDHVTGRTWSLKDYLRGQW
jgi:peptide chain release factor 1